MVPLDKGSKEERTIQDFLLPEITSLKSNKSDNIRLPALPHVLVRERLVLFSNFCVWLYVCVCMCACMCGATEVAYMFALMFAAETSKHT